MNAPVENSEVSSQVEIMEQTLAQKTAALKDISEALGHIGTGLDEIQRCSRDFFPLALFRMTRAYLDKVASAAWVEGGGVGPYVKQENDEDSIPF
jgi:hypothetical protein